MVLTECSFIGELSLSDSHWTVCKFMISLKITIFKCQTTVNHLLLMSLFKTQFKKANKRVYFQNMKSNQIFKKKVSQFPQKYWAEHLFSTFVKIENVFWAANQHIRMISEGSCDTEDWSNDAENSALITGINYILEFITIENCYFKM